MDREMLEQRLDAGMSVAAIGRELGRHESTVAYWMLKHGLSAAHRERHVARGGIPKERLVELVESGASIAEMASALDRSKTTVRHWLRRYGLATANSAGRRRSTESRAGIELGCREVEMSCSRHGLTVYVIDGRGYYRCRKCRSEAVSRRRRKVKAILVAEAGGACCLCGYQESHGALQFHHLDPAAKTLELNARGVARSIETLRSEARKCVLLCANCHAEVEMGIKSVGEIEEARIQCEPAPVEDPGSHDPG